MQKKEIVPMLGMTIDEWHATLQRGMDRKEVEVTWREKIAAALIALHLPEERWAARKRLDDVLRGHPSEKERYARAVEIMIQLIPAGLQKSLRPKGHLLTSASRNYLSEHDLLYLAINGIFEVAR
jgi:hypothetical protein